MLRAGLGINRTLIKVSYILSLSLTICSSSLALSFLCSCCAQPAHSSNTPNFMPPCPSTFCFYFVSLSLARCLLFPPGNFAWLHILIGKSLLHGPGVPCASVYCTSYSAVWPLLRYIFITYSSLVFNTWYQAWNLVCSDNQVYKYYLDLMLFYKSFEEEYRRIYYELSVRASLLEISFYLFCLFRKSLN